LQTTEGNTHSSHVPFHDWLFRLRCVVGKMNGFDEKRGLNDDDFGAKGNMVSAFDAFRTCKEQLSHATGAAMAGGSMNK
jgi:hypothetical protein